MSPGSTRTAETPWSRSSAASVLRQELERRLAGAVRTPARIRAVRRIARDVDDEAATRGEQRHRELDERDRRAGVDREHAAEALDVERQQRADSAELRRVVDQHVEAAELAGGIDPPAPNRGVRDVAGDRHDAAPRC